MELNRGMRFVARVSSFAPPKRHHLQNSPMAVSTAESLPTRRSAPRPKPVAQLDTEDGAWDPAPSACSVPAAQEHIPLAQCEYVVLARWGVVLPTADSLRR
ncbi:hypothetical protein B0H10DRAFT_2240057 [Mycena sp. CBHHK59/15]|nr:hypothetical protein B0H10DRAFT_2240604 [Mycena sp. CBHHK59/15]KAJ6561296.1 hypothetical protein B0H10DRAFT_2240057 [Mycena sp. CBHHK59/15]